MTLRIAVIGAGPLGLVALKTLREDGFDALGFESRPYVGGLWKYSKDSSLSVAESTIFNSSRYRSAISDFPFPDDTDDFPTWQQMHQYLEAYCDHFDLRPYINLDSPVTHLSRAGEQWVLEISPSGLPSRQEYFDKVIVATGSFVKPKTPYFDGIEQFEGPSLHAINFHDPTQYQGRNVLLIGLHATAQDVSVTLSRYASKVYISHRSGVILVCLLNRLFSV
jgi:dimethylaniline monooxygenase (N-oxide forming)